MMKKIEAKNSIAHSSAIMSLSMLQAFTQDDSFLQIKENLEWAAKCTHWNKFTSIASFGLIYKNNKDKKVFQKFLPESNQGDAVNTYSNGGALYGLGLSFTGTSNQEIIDYIFGVLTNPTHSQNEVVMHGACLGLGLTAFASGNEAIGERLKDILNSSTSVMGEASALSLGLTFAGTNNEAILSDLIAFAQDTEHEKILRSICIAIGLISFQSPSLEFLENLENNPSLKMALPMYMACAYFGTSNPLIVRKLLKLSNDISNEVKRTAIIALGFVMYNDQKLTDVIKMLLYSYNPFIRYGCVMALAIGSKDNKEAIDMIWPLLNDSVDFVRQGVYVSLAILFQVSTNNSEPKLADFRKTVEEIISKTHV
jgi:26S proteasome regulatory subunit N2